MEAMALEIQKVENRVEVDELFATIDNVKKLPVSVQLEQ